MAFKKVLLKNKFRKRRFSKKGVVQGNPKRKRRVNKKKNRRVKRVVKVKKQTLPNKWIRL